jgi:hypothetical protein
MDPAGDNKEEIKKLSEPLRDLESRLKLLESSNAKSHQDRKPQDLELYRVHYLDKTKLPDGESMLEEIEAIGQADARSLFRKVHPNVEDFFVTHKGQEDAERQLESLRLKIPGKIEAAVRRARYEVFDALMSAAGWLGEYVDGSYCWRKQNLKIAFYGRWDESKGFVVKQKNPNGGHTKAIVGIFPTPLHAMLAIDSASAEVLIKQARDFVIAENVSNECDNRPGET